MTTKRQKGRAGEWLRSGHTILIWHAPSDKRYRAAVRNREGRHRGVGVGYTVTKALNDVPKMEDGQ